ncbi:uncharacterized protein [Heterodontus francisci]|uniref:uncharacterized protein n=1 Tax=Heterodontus francisci TaxID=7792 RepID=UPI00355B6E96
MDRSICGRQIGEDEVKYVFPMCWCPITCRRPSLAAMSFRTRPARSSSKNKNNVLQNLRTGNAKELKPHQLSRHKRAWVLATFDITEEDEGPFPKFVAQLQNDRSQNYSLWYKIMGPGVDQDPERGLFAINGNNGNLYVHRKVDRETTSIFKLTVDALQKNSANILDRSLIYQIRVKDINDNPPVFSKDIYHVQVSESTAPGQSIFKIEAMDKDEKNNPNSIISYYLVSETKSPASGMFAIDQENGTITLEKCLDYQKITSYKLLIRARDHGALIQHSSSATVIINVEDGNNNPPTFVSQSASGTVYESNTKAVILKVKVTDEDQLTTAGWKAKYTIIKGNEKGNYKIETEPETNDGILSLIQHLDYEGGPERKLQIAVENEEPLFTCPGKNSEIRTAEPQTMTVIINVVDENDPPIFDIPELSVVRKEGLLPGVVLARMNATDPDKIFKNHIRYVKAQDPGELVSVDEKTGVVTTLKQLDREAPYMNRSIYDIIIHAVDDGVPPLTGTATMHLHLSDINDNTPYLVNQHQHMCINGNVRSINIIAADDDEDPFSGPFTFKLMNTKVFGKEMWKLGTTYGTSSQLMSLQDPLPGTYAVPFEIKDRQGISKENVLNLRVCHCPDEVECENLEASRSVGAGTAIGVLLVSLLLLFLASCLFLFCHSSNKMRTNLVLYDEPNGTLIKYNEEGGGAASAAGFISRFLPEESGHLVTCGIETSGTFQMKNENILKHKPPDPSRLTFKREKTPTSKEVKACTGPQRTARLTGNQRLHIELKGLSHGTILKKSWGVIPGVLANIYSSIDIIKTDSLIIITFLFVGSRAFNLQLFKAGALQREEGMHEDGMIDFHSSSDEKYVEEDAKQAAVPAQVQRPPQSLQLLELESLSEELKSYCPHSGEPPTVEEGCQPFNGGSHALARLKHNSTYGIARLLHRPCMTADCLWQLHQMLPYLSLQLQHILYCQHQRLDISQGLSIGQASHSPPTSEHIPTNLRVPVLVEGAGECETVHPLRILTPGPQSTTGSQQRQQTIFPLRCHDLHEKTQTFRGSAAWIYLCQPCVIWFSISSFPYEALVSSTGALTEGEGELSSTGSPTRVARWWLADPKRYFRRELIRAYAEYFPNSSTCYTGRNTTKQVVCESRSDRSQAWSTLATGKLSGNTEYPGTFREAVPEPRRHREYRTRHSWHRVPWWATARTIFWPPPAPPQSLTSEALFGCHNGRLAPDTSPYGRSLGMRTSSILRTRLIQQNRLFLISGNTLGSSAFDRIAAFVIFFISMLFSKLLTFSFPADMEGVYLHTRLDYKVTLQSIKAEIYNFVLSSIFPKTKQPLSQVSTFHGYNSRTEDDLMYMDGTNFSVSTISPARNQTVSRCGTRRNLGDLIDQRVYFYNDREDIQDDYEPHVYAHEGRSTSIISLDSLTNTEKSDGFNYLHQMGPEFKTHGEICQLNSQKNVQHN